MLLFDATWLSRDYGGIARDSQSFARFFQGKGYVRFLYERDTSFEFNSGAVLKHKMRTYNQLALLRNKTIKDSSWDGNFFQQHITGLQSPSYGRGTTFLRLHDIFPLTNPTWFPVLSRRLFYVGARDLDSRTILVCNSRFTQSEAKKHPLFKSFETAIVPCLADDFTKAGLACNACNFCTSKFDFNNFLLAVGTIEPRKNYQRLLDAWSVSGKVSGFDQLVIAGRAGWKNRSILDSLRKANRVVWLTPCDYGLGKLFRLARAYVSASLAEGFDIPSVTAQNLGIPSALSDIEVHGELCPDAIVRFQPDNICSISRAICAVATTNAGKIGFEKTVNSFERSLRNIDFFL